jgi:pimeloyl-ACP methyl ester carboxylesterase
MRRLVLLSALLLSSACTQAFAQESLSVQAAGPSGPLAGTLIKASESGGPVMLLLPGSGPTDRDGNNPLGVAAAPYRMLAEALGSRGISTVRIDKRGMFGSAGAVADGNAVTIPDYVRDVRSWIRAIRERTGVSCVWLLGHSEGSLVALTAAQAPDNICGVVLVAGPGRRVADSLRDQLRANPANAPLLDAALAAISRLEAGERVDTAGMHPALMQLFAPQVQGFLISMFSYDPAELVARLRMPVLIVQGTEDIQVGEQDARRLAAANPQARLVLLPGVNHVLKQVAAGDRAANIATYSNPNLPLATCVADAVAGFVNR